MLKHDLLRRVLEDGTVDVYGFQEQVASDEVYLQALEFNAAVFLEVLLNACGVIDAYCSGRASDTGGGTGLEV